MKYKELSTQVKRSINGSLFSQFSSGCLDFKGEEEAFNIWYGIKFYPNDNGEGYYFRMAKDRYKEDLYIDEELLQDLKEIVMARYRSRMKSLYWNSEFLRS